MEGRILRARRLSGGGCGATEMLRGKAASPLRPSASFFSPETEEDYGATTTCLSNRNFSYFSPLSSAHFPLPAPAPLAPAEINKFVVVGRSVNIKLAARAAAEN